MCIRDRWQGEPAYAHILLDVTEEKLKQGKLEQEAYFDRLTSIGLSLRHILPVLLQKAGKSTCSAVF